MDLQRAYHECHVCYKSITSLLVGIAIDKGFIRSVNDKIMDYFHLKPIKLKRVKAQSMMLL